MSITSKKQKNLERDYLRNDTERSITYTGMIPLDHRCFAPSRQQRSQQRDAADHRGTSQSWSYYKLNHVSMKRVNRVTLARKNTLFFVFCLLRRIMKKRFDEKRKVSFADSSRNCTLLRKEIFYEGAS